MLRELKEYLKPKSVEEAWAIYRDPVKSPALFLTGGLSVAQREDQTTKTLVDLSGLLGESITETPAAYILDGGVRIADCIKKNRYTLPPGSVANGGVAADTEYVHHRGDSGTTVFLVGHPHRLIGA